MVSINSSTRERSLGTSWASAFRFSLSSSVKVTSTNFFHHYVPQPNSFMLPSLLKFLLHTVYIMLLMMEA